MTHKERPSLRTLALGSCAALALAFAGQARAEARPRFEIAGQDLKTALQQFASQGDQQVLFSTQVVAGKKTAGITGEDAPEHALQLLLAGTGLTYSKTNEGALLVTDPQGASAGGGAETNVVQELVVTAQKKEEAIQTVPIAISAFTPRSLEEQHIEGGFDLLKAIPNVSFSKNNFTSYNFSIRGIGTKAVSATTDPGVAVAFNNTALLQNRLFEQEYFDVERVEVLRGPQGTLYGRNATAGVINVISAKPDMSEFKGSIKGEVGNYNAKRVSAMINIPIVNDKLAVRFAGALTDRQGYDYNSVTKNHVNGRDLWSGRVTVAFNPIERLRTNFIWEHFNEDDNRSRTGKQLCHRDPSKLVIGDTPTTTNPRTGDNTTPFWSVLRPAVFSTGCRAGSLYDDDAFGTPNGLALPFVYGILILGADCGEGCNPAFPLGVDAQGRSHTLLQLQDPYGGMMQSRDLRTIASFRDPVYRAKADVFEFNLEFDISDSLTLASQTAYNKDSVYSFQDFNRFNTVPVFTDTSQLINSPWSYLAPGGIFCDPQVGCSNTLAGFDISQANGKQWSQELRLQSNFSGPVNFSVGANYTKFETLIDYYVFYNLISAYAQTLPFNAQVNDVVDPSICAANDFIGLGTPVPTTDPHSFCPYIDPNPIESIDGNGHNYFRSKNPYKLNSAAVFGELYWNISNALKLTAGLRYTDDRKTFIPVPSQVLLAPSIVGGGTVPSGYPEDPPIKQKWGEFTGRLGVDWKPDLGFTDATMVYAFYSHGYKGGGANPPKPGFATSDDLVRAGIISADDAAAYTSFGLLPILKLNAAEYKDTFEPEFVDAFEIGAKNTLLGGTLTANLSAFFYNYKDYQVSQIRDRTAVNENFDAKVWGVEVETVFAPSRRFQMTANLGYLDTRIADGETSIDIMNRTQGNPNYVVVKPWVQLPSNCVVPLAVAENLFKENILGYWNLCGGVKGLLAGQGAPPIDPATGAPYDPLAVDASGHLVHPEINGGAGLLADLGGNKLPNAPHWTANIGAQYSIDILEGWRVTLHGDAYWQSQSWARVYNEDPYDKLHGWYNVNLALWFEKPDMGLKIEIYAKNLLDKSPITDAFLNSDDTALTTNVFTLDPRLIGFSITKKF